MVESLSVEGRGEKEIMDVQNGLHLASQYANKIESISKFPKTEMIMTELNKRILWYDTEPEGRQYLGHYRTTSSMITRATIQPPSHYYIGKLMREFTKELDERVSSLGHGADHVENMLETISFAHHKLVSIHPFGDGNGRTARSLVDIILRHFKYKRIIISKRDEGKYFSALDRASVTGDLGHLTLFLADKLESAYKERSKPQDLPFISNIRNLKGKLSQRLE